MLSGVVNHASWLRAAPSINTIESIAVAAGYLGAMFGANGVSGGSVLLAAELYAPGRLAEMALLTRMTRSSMLEVLGQEYITTAWAKGLNERMVVFKHAFKNALITIVTVVGLIFALSLGGSVLIENVFAIPGLGRLIVTAAIRRDYPIVEGGMIYFTVIALFVNLLVDISYTFINPKIIYKP